MNRNNWICLFLMRCSNKGNNQRKEGLHFKIIFRLTTTSFIFKFELIHTYIYIKCKFMHKYYIHIISFIDIAFFIIKEFESSALHREVLITMFVWERQWVFFRHSVPLCEDLSGLKCPLHSLYSAYFREISTYRKLEGGNLVPEQYRSDPLKHELFISSP